ncbi:unnamed protein product [Pedinophyceae sp. YPF-701]|nr:unnamed protein product [Pedinophyceae sp. YPF-701]
MAAASRLQRELRELLKSASDDLGIHLEPDPTTLFRWRAVIQGPPGTPFEGGSFRLALTVPEGYPHQPPMARFETPIFHPNIHFKTGEVCLDILKSKWTPAWGLLSTTQAILALLSDPAAESPLNCDAGNLLRAGDTAGFEALARKYTLELAQPPKSREAGAGAGGGAGAGDGGLWLVMAVLVLAGVALLYLRVQGVSVM